MRTRARARSLAAATVVSVVALVATGGPAVAAPVSLSFAGYTWTVKSSGVDQVGPGPNYFSDSPENVRVDSTGQLHLRITYRNGQWQSAEVVLDRSLGYGTYRFNLASPVGDLDPNVVLGLFTWNDDPAYNHREVDVEFSRWGNAGDPTNAQYVVQPYDKAGNLRRFSQPAMGTSSHSFAWNSKRVQFTSSAGNGQAVANWTYSGKSVPRAGGEHARINLWLFGGAPPQNGAEIEVVISGFTFTP